MSVIARLVTAFAVLVLAACDSGSDEGDADASQTASAAGMGGAAGGSDAGAPLDGEAVYMRPVEDGNTFACATCHALQEPAPDGLVRPGHPIGDATARPSYKQGQVTDMREAVNNCLEHWMNAQPWAQDDPRWTALHDWLDAMAPAQSEALDFAIVEPPTDLTGGDAENGRDVFNGRCVVCHGQDGTGTNRAPPVTGLGLDGEYVAERIRTSGGEGNPIYDGLTGGIMPFWAEDRLSDEQLRDLVAYLAQQDDSGSDAGASTGSVIDTGVPRRDCDATHPNVGQSAEFTTAFHNVGGTATIIDDCTIEITDFTYDGTGIDVRLYGGLGGNYVAGFPMSGDLLKPGGYAGDTLFAVLPENKTLDDLNGLSVWCVDVGIDFGSARF